jgi:hypothetical protein
LRAHLTNLRIGKGATDALKQSLKNFIDENSQRMYQNASKILTEKLNEMRLLLSREIATAAREAQGKLKKDILHVINLGGVGKASTKSKATAELRAQVKNSLLDMEESWLKELETPEDLRARNPFVNISIHGASDDEGNDDDHSDDSEESEESEEESESSDEDCNDLDDGDYKA